MKKFTIAAVLLFATACLFSCSKSDPGTPLPVAGFNYPQVSETSATVLFTNTSTSATSYNWDFGDGSTSTLTSPSHTYASAGTYTVTLTVTNSAGTDVATGTLNIGAASINISHITISNVPNSIVYHTYVYMIWQASNGQTFTGSSFYITSSSGTSSLGWNLGSNPLSNFSTDNKIYVFEQTGASQNPSSDIQLFGTTVNFTAPDNSGFINNGIYLTTINYGGASSAYRQTFTATWQ